MSTLLGFIISAAAVVIGYTQARSFVSARLRYVDAAQSGFAPILAAAGALALGTLLAGILPLVGFGTAVSFAIAVGLGVASGQRDTRRLLPPGT